MIRIYYCTYQYTAFKHGVDLSPDGRSFVATRIFANVYETSFQLQLCTHESCDPHHRELFGSNDKTLTLGTTKFFKPLDALVASLQSCETLHQSNDLTALLQQFVFYSFVIFLFFFLDHTLRRSTCTWLVHTCCSIALYLECHNIWSPWYYVRLSKCILYKGSIIDYAYTYHIDHETLF